MTTRWTPRRIAAEVGRRAKRLADAPDADAVLRKVEHSAPPEGPPEVSVIVVLHDVERYIANCLDSIVEQGLRDLEVIVVDDGSRDGSRRIADEYAEQDQRIRIVARDHGGLGAARNTAVAQATGEYLTFVGSTDELAPGALEAMVVSARHSGSDIVVGSVRQFTSEHTRRPEWVGALHTQPRTSIAIDDLPALVRHNETWGKLYRRSFWAAQGSGFREGVSYEDQPLIVQLYCAASGIDVVTDVVYLDRLGTHARFHNQQIGSLRDLRDQISAWRITRQSFGSTMSRPVYHAWLQTLFDAHFHRHLGSTGTSDLAYWATLRDAIADLSHDAPGWIWESTAPERRVPIELALRNRRGDVQEFMRRAGYLPGKFPASVVEGGVYHELPFHDDPDLDRWLFVRTPEQLELSHSVQSFGWEDGSTMRLGGWAYIRHIDLVGRDSTTTLILRNLRTGAEYSVDASHGDPGYPPPDEDDWTDYRGGEFECAIAMDEAIGTGCRDGDEWDLRLRVETIGFSVEEAVSRFRRSGSAGMAHAGELAQGDLLTVAGPPDTPLRLVLRSPLVEAVDIGLEKRRLRGRLTGMQAAGVRFVKLVGPGVPATRSPVDNKTFALEVPELGVDRFDPSAMRRARVVAELESGAEVTLARRGAEALDDVQVLDGAALALERTRDGELGVAEWRAAAYADSLEVSSHGVARITGHVYGPDVETVSVRLDGQRSRIASAAVSLHDSRFVAEIGLTHEPYGFGEHPLPSGIHGMTAEVRVAGESLDLPMRVSPELNPTLPVQIATGHHEGLVERGEDDVVSLSLVPPLGGAAGRCRQNRLRATSGAQFTTGRRRGLLIRSYGGESATDSGLGVQRELQRRGADIDIYWSVHDHSVPVPDGVIPVIQDSYEWYGVLNTSKYYLDNMYQPYYHEKPDGQVIIQTLHGYPFKTMGHAYWEQQRCSRAQIESYDARAREWDYLVSPASYATRLLTRDFAYSGEVLEIGYPRNDILFDATAPRLRAEVRRSLGIREHQRVVLYAPAVRDYLLPDDPRTATTGFLDVDKVAAALGDDYVILVRGHATNARTRYRTVHRDGVVDVTDYPVVSDLYLAADAAVVDYSSLRFDFGITGKPMIFHVPDIETYKSARGWLFDFEPTAPGPRVETTAEVVEALLELDAVATKYRDSYDTFRHAYLDLEDGGASARLVDAVFVPRGDAPPAARGNLT